MKTKLFRGIISPLVIISFLIIFHVSYAQDATVKGLQSDANKAIDKTGKIDSSKIWNTGGLFNLNIGQGSQSNWAAGGDDFSFSLNTYLGLYGFYKKGRYSWDNTLEMNYGVINTTSVGTRKNDDRIDLLSKGGYGLTKNLSLSGLLNFHSQFAKGYSYDKDGSKTLLSDFLAPGYVLLGLGLDYKPVEGLSIFVSPITSRWTIVNNDTLSAHGAYGVTPGKKVRNEIGAFASINYMKKITKTILYKGRLDLFSNYEHNPQDVDVNMTNMFQASISKVFSVNLNINLI
ncbi:MAG TPA: DUF3078 domain-containing protein [Hanamia sp.]